MRIALISDTFPPLNNSGAVQLRDLSREFVRQEHALTVITSSPDQKNLGSWRIRRRKGVTSESSKNQGCFKYSSCTK